MIADELDVPSDMAVALRARNWRAGRIAYLLLFFPTINFFPSTGLMSRIRAIFRVICSSVFVATHGQADTYFTQFFL